MYGLSLLFVAKCREMTCGVRQSVSFLHHTPILDPYFLSNLWWMAHNVILHFSTMESSKPRSDPTYGLEDEDLLDMVTKIAVLAQQIAAATTTKEDTRTQEVFNRFAERLDAKIHKYLSQESSKNE